MIRRVLRHLDRQADPRHTRRGALDPGESALAADVVRLAWDGRRDPFGDAYRQHCPFADQWRDDGMPVAAIAPDPPAAIDELDGRTGQQWVKSVLLYLRWRSGSDWRPLTQRFCEPMCVYQSAHRVFYDAFYLNTFSLPHSAGAEASGAAADNGDGSNGTRPHFSGEKKKPPQRARAAAAGARLA